MCASIVACVNYCLNDLFLLSGVDGNQGAVMLLPPPLFSYQEINVSAGIAGLAPFIQINQNVCRILFSDIADLIFIINR